MPLKDSSNFIFKKRAQWCLLTDATVTVLPPSQCIQRSSQQRSAGCKPRANARPNKRTRRAWRHHTASTFAHQHRFCLNT